MGKLTMPLSEADPIAEKMSNLAMSLSLALRQHGKAVDASTVLDGIKAVAAMQEWMNFAEKQNNESILSVESWCVLATDAAHGCHLARQELDKWL